MNSIIGSRYKKGFCIAKMNSSDEWGDDSRDCVIKELIVHAEQNDIKDWELVARVEPETISIAENGEDHGGLHQGQEIYRLPFPENLKIRKEIIRSFIKFPKYYEG